MEDLFEPQLSHGQLSGTKSYTINNLFYVAFLGGVLPLLVLGTRNAKWLKVDKGKIQLLLIAGIAVLLARCTLNVLLTFHVIIYDAKNIRLIFRAISVLLYLGYYYLMKPNYRLHIMSGGAATPLFKDALIWIVIGLVIELLLGMALWEVLQRVI